MIQSQGAPRSTAAPKVYGILSIIFGAITVVVTLFSGCMAAMMKASPMGVARPGVSGGAAIGEAYARYFAATHTATIIQTILFIVFSIALLFIGIGQLRYRRWARSASLIWGVGALLGLAATVVVTRVIVSPATTALYDTLQQAYGAGSIEAKVQEMMRGMVSGSVMSVITVVLYAPYPLLLLLQFSRARMREAMRD